MSKWAALVGSNGAMVVSATAVAVAAVAAGVYINNRSAPEPAALVQPVTAEQEPVAEAQAVTPAPEDVAEAVVAPPSIDEVRMEADGLTIVAGRASPGSKVSVLLDGVENTTVTTDSGGGFAAITMIMPKSTAQVLTIVQRLGDEALPSLDEIILAPTTVPVAVAEAAPVAEAEPAPLPVAEAVPETIETVETVEAEVAAVTPEPSPDVVEVAPLPIETETVVADATPAPQPEPAPTITVTEAVAETSAAQTQTPATAPQDAPPSQTATAEVIETAPVPAAEVPQQVTVLKSTAEGVEVLGTPPEALDSIAIDTISYSNLGDVQLAGRAQSEADVVRVYVDNRPVTVLEVDAQGRWRGDLPDIDTGVYTLRVDEVNAAGGVTSRVETPFKREDPQALAEADTPSAAATQITVQTGATLWAIARDRYGEGRLFVQVFEANRAAIADPDLIYPGQVFALPD